MIFYPEATLTDGAAAAASDGFFNHCNVPAWDTWVGAVTFNEDPCFGSGLVCWIPPWLVAKVAEGVEVNPEECIRWLDEVSGTLPSQLVTAGLLAG